MFFSPFSFLWHLFYPFLLIRHQICANHHDVLVIIESWHLPASTQLLAWTIRRVTEWTTQRSEENDAILVFSICKWRAMDKLLQCKKDQKGTAAKDQLQNPKGFPKKGIERVKIHCVSRVVLRLRHLVFVRRAWLRHWRVTLQARGNIQSGSSIPREAYHSSIHH